MPEGFPPMDLPPQPAVFAPDYAPEDIAEIAAEAARGRRPAEGADRRRRERPDRRGRARSRRSSPEATAGAAAAGRAAPPRCPVLAGRGGSYRGRPMRRYLEILRTPHVGRAVRGARCSRGCRSGSTGSRSCCCCARRPARSAIAGAAAGALALGTGLGAPLAAAADRRARRARAARARRGQRAAAARRDRRSRRAGAPAAALVAAALVAGARVPAGLVGAARAATRVLFGDRPDADAGRVRAGLRADRVDLHRRRRCSPPRSSSCSSRRRRCSCRRSRVLAGTVALVAALPPAPRTRVASRRGRPAGRARRAGHPHARRVDAAGRLRVRRARGRAARRSPTPRARPELAGVLIALWSLGSVAGGLAYGARPRRGVARERPPARRAAAAAQLPPARARDLAGGDGAARRAGRAC